MEPELLVVGRIARAHGVRGRVLLQPYNDASEGLERASALWLQQRASPQAVPSGTPRRYEVGHAERVNLGYLVTLRGVDGKDAADALRGSEVLVDREELPKLDADELYAVDLVGMKVCDGSGVERGEIVGLEAAGPNDLLQVRDAAGISLVPMGLVRAIDSEGKRVTIDAPEGLFDMNVA